MLPKAAYRISHGAEFLYDKLLEKDEERAKPQGRERLFTHTVQASSIFLENERILEFDSGDLSQLRKDGQVPKLQKDVECPVCLFPVAQAQEDMASPMLSASADDFVSPFTNNLVIVNRQVLPKKVIMDLQFQNPKMHNSLVQELEYNKTSGQIYYDIKERDEMGDDGYARVITLNSWYQELSLSLLSAALLILNIYSNIIFSTGLIARHRVLNIHLELPLLFTLLYVVLEILAIIQAYKRARAEMPKGDLITEKDLNFVDRNYALHAMALFYYLGLNSMVRDIIVWLHPFKNVQPYAAAKADGKRFYLLGFASEYMFRCDAAVGQDLLMVTQVSVQTVLLTFKICLSLKTWDLTSACLTVPGIVMVFMRIRAIKSLVQDKEVHWAWLNERWAELGSGNLERNEADMRKTLTKQKQLHFADESWGESFRGWRTISRRFTTVLFMVGALAAFLFFDLRMAGLGLDRMMKVYERHHGSASGLGL